MAEGEGDGEELPEAASNAREALVASINEGRPALMDSEECGLIVGTIGDGEDFLIRPYRAEFTETKEGYSVMDGWPWQVGIIIPRNEAPSRRASILKSLRAAIEMANTPEQSGYPSGLAA